MINGISQVGKKFSIASSIKNKIATQIKARAFTGIFRFLTVML
jgi:hypothetical protein